MKIPGLANRNRLLGWGWLGVFMAGPLWGVDSDGDGYLDTVENHYDWNVSLVDERRSGGISKTSSETIGVSLGAGGLVKVSSDPPGMTSEYSIGVQSGGNHMTATIDPIVGTKRFLYWERNGQIVRGLGGVPHPEIKENNASNGSNLVAKFTELSEDSDNDEMKDWFERRVQDITLERDDDPDGDGYTLFEEHEHGFSPFLKDSRRRGGTSSSRSAVSPVTLGNGGVLDVLSDPIGVINSVSLPMSNDDSYDTEVVNPIIGNQRFLYWERDGVIQRGPGGVPLQRYTETNVGWGKTLTAKFMNQNTNTDGGLADWIEMRLGGMHVQQDDDNDTDGYSLLTERKYGFSIFLADTRRRGGFSKSASGTLTIHAPNDVPVPPAPPDADGDGIADVYDLDTDGDGSTDEEEFGNGTDPNDDQSFTLQQFLALEDSLNIDFSQNTVTPLQSNGWEGFASSLDTSDPVEHSYTRVHGVDGSIEVKIQGQSHWRDYAVIHGGDHKPWTNLLSDVVFCNNEGTITITLKDLKPGRFRMKTFHHLAEDYGNTKFDLKVSDADGSNQLRHANVGTSHGVTPASISTREFSFLVNHASDDVNITIGPGGDIANHMGINGFEMRRFLTENPTSIELSNTEVMENQKIGTIIGNFSGTDPDVNASLDFLLVNGVGALHNSMVMIDGNGTLRTNSEIDRETIPNLFLRAMVRDEFGATLEKIFTIKVTDDPVEDNTAPHEISLSPLTVSEDLSVGGKVGEFGALDIDVNATERFELIDGNGSLNNGHFQLDVNGSLFLASPLDFETNQSMEIRAIVIDEYNGSLQGEFVLQVLDVFEDLDGDGTQDHLDDDEDGDGFLNIVELAYPSDPRDPQSVANTAPVSISYTGGNATIYENSANATVISQLIAVDPDANDTLSFSLVSGTGDTENGSFQISSGGLLVSTRIFDFETFVTDQLIRVRVADQHGAYFEENMTVRLLNIVEDLDGDTIEDHYDTDDDGDGFSDVVEIAYPSDPRDPNSVANVPPHDIRVATGNNLSFSENINVGHLVGILAGLDADVNASLSFELIGDGNFSFAVSSFGWIRTTEEFDFETDPHAYSLTVVVADQHNATYSETVALSLTNLVEDLDGDGVEDHYDPDDDGDGFSDILEIGYPSDPRDPNSVANVAPISISFADGNATFYENSTNATVVTQMTAVDPDTNDTLSFSLISGMGDKDNGSFQLSTGGILSTARVFDFETFASVQLIRVRVADQHGANYEENMSVHLLNLVEDLDGDGVEDHYDPDDDGDGFSDLVELNYPSDPRDPNSVANVPPNDLWIFGGGNLTVFENQAVGAKVGMLAANDPDTGDTLRFTVSNAEKNSFSINHLGEILTLAVFDFETDELNRTVEVMVFDQHSASYVESIEVRITNLVEDLDGDGVEEHYDLDDDGDGFSDAEEIAYGSDPMDKDSWANTPPDSIVPLDLLMIEENLPSLSRVTRFTATDPDGDSVGFSVLDGSSRMESEDFEIDQTGVLRTSKTFDYEERSLHTIWIRAMDGIEYLELPFTVSVIDIDEIPPVISLIGPEIVFHPTESVYSDSGAVWVDGFDGTGNIAAVGTVNTELPGTYELSYDITDLAGNVAKTAIRKVLVVDQSMPMIALHGSSVVNHPLWEPFIDPGAEAYDAVDGNLTGEINVSGSVDTGTPGTYLFQYRVKDSVNNDSQTLFRQVIIENHVPVNLRLSQSVIEENTPVGGLVAKIEFLDSDDPQRLRKYNYRLTRSGNSAELPFSIASDGTLRLESVIDYEDTPSYEFAIRVSDEFGASVEENFEIRVLDAFVPIVRTGQYRMAEDGTYTLSGEVLDRGAIAGLYERGIVVADYPEPKITDSDASVLRSSAQSDYFIVSAKLNFGPSFYFRAYAINGEGISYGASTKTKMTAPASEKRYIEWAGAFPMETGGAWWYSPWFGYFYAKQGNGKEWIYQADLGWLFANPRDGEGIWFWSEARKWFWTSREIFPRAYSNFTDSWFVLPAEKLPELSVLEVSNGNGANYSDSLFSNLSAQKMSNGRWQSPWFGSFYHDIQTGMLYHDKYGQINYLSGEGKNDAWIWLETLNWVWTSSEFYPFIYKNHDLSWYFLHGSTNNNIILFDYDEDKWIKIPKLN